MLLRSPSVSKYAADTTFAARVAFLYKVAWGQSLTEDGMARYIRFLVDARTVLYDEPILSQFTAPGALKGLKGLEPERKCLARSFLSWIRRNEIRKATTKSGCRLRLSAAGASLCIVRR